MINTVNFDSLQKSLLPHSSAQKTQRRPLLAGKIAHLITSKIYALCDFHQNCLEPGKLIKIKITEISFSQRNYNICVIKTCALSVSSSSSVVKFLSVMLLFLHEQTSIFSVLLCLKESKYSSFISLIDKRNGKTMPVSWHERP